MKYHDSPRSFRTKHWLTLWKNNIPNRLEVQELAPNTVFVAIDTEVWPGHDKCACEVGLALLFPVNNSKHQQCPRTLKAIRERFFVQTHYIRILGREHSMRNREHFVAPNNEPITEIGSEKVEDTMVGILRSAIQQWQVCHLTSPDCKASCALNFTLVGYDLSAEFSILAKDYPRVLTFLDSWVDLQELVADSSNLKPGLKPSMRDTLRALGFGADEKAVLPPHFRHNAANDALRAIAVLSCLLAMPLNARIEISQEPIKRYRGYAAKILHERIEKGSNFFSWHIPPGEEFPFIAKVSLIGPMPLHFTSRKVYPKDLYNYFSAFCPSAVRVNTSESRLRGWLFFSSLYELDWFVEQTHGLRDVDGRGIWIALSQYDPAKTPVTTAAEVAVFCKQKRIAEVAEKKRLRNIKKELLSTSLDVWEGIENIVCSISVAS